MGLEGEKWAVGVSGKVQDGISSGNQKQFKNHAGVDFMCKPLPYITFSGEFIYDQFGFYKDFPIASIDWPRSLYYRDYYYKRNTPISGFAGYLDRKYAQNSWLAELNYGEYHPQKIGVNYVDAPNRRFIAKLAYDPFFLPGSRVFGFVMVENKQKNSPAEESIRCDQNGFVGMVGAQYDF